MASRIAALLMLATAVAFFVAQNNQRRPLAQKSPPAAKESSPQAQSLTDEQLLSLFPDTPVGLATLPNGKKLLIFPHPGDEAKFITRL